MEVFCNARRREATERLPHLSRDRYATALEPIVGRTTDTGSRVKLYRLSLPKCISLTVIFKPSLEISSLQTSDFERVRK